MNYNNDDIIPWFVGSRTLRHIHQTGDILENEIFIAQQTHRSHKIKSMNGMAKSDDNNDNHGDEEYKHPIWHCMVAGLMGGVFGDSSMHSLDTVKTRQQAAPNILKYRNTTMAYKTIFMEEGIRRGLYAGYSAALLGSIPSGLIFFGTYEFIKQKCIGEYSMNETLVHLGAGFSADLATSVLYVPSEVLKARLQLQGRYNNPFFHSGYNYKGILDAASQIAKHEGFRAFFYGYRATLCRDLPFSALQFAFYEKFRQWSFIYEGKSSNLNNGASSRELSLTAEILTGALAGGIAGIITTPLDVFKTRLQTQNPGSISTSTLSLLGVASKDNKMIIHNAEILFANNATIKTPKVKEYHTSTANVTAAINKPAILNTNSVFKGLYIVYKTEGVLGLFSGVQPRFIWASVQSSVMLLFYQTILKQLEGVGDSSSDRKFA